MQSIKELLAEIKKEATPFQINQKQRNDVIAAIEKTFSDYKNDKIEKHYSDNIYKLKRCLSVCEKIDVMAIAKKLVEETELYINNKLIIDTNSPNRCILLDFNNEKLSIRQDVPNPSIDKIKICFEDVVSVELMCNNGTKFIRLADWSKLT